MNLLEAIYPELQKIVAEESKRSSRTIICRSFKRTLGKTQRIRIQRDGFNTDGFDAWLDFEDDKIMFYYNKFDNSGLHFQTEDWTDPDLLQKIKTHITAIAGATPKA